MPRLGEILLALDVSLAVLLVLLVVVHCTLGQLSVLVFLLLIRILIHTLMLLNVIVFRVLHLVHVHLLHLVQGLKHALVVILGLLHFFLEVDVIPAPKQVKEVGVDFLRSPVGNDLTNKVVFSGLDTLAHETLGIGAHGGCLCEVKPTPQA